MKLDTKLGAMPKVDNNHIRHSSSSDSDSTYNSNVQKVIQRKEQMERTVKHIFDNQIPEISTPLLIPDIKHVRSEITYDI